jgi:hypothetical protein
MLSPDPVHGSRRPVDATGTPVRDDGPMVTPLPSRPVDAGAVDRAGSPLAVRPDATGSFLSIGSTGSILSIGSAGSILSIGSAGSVLSIGSAGSILSIGSLGSIASIASAYSVGSLLSVLSVGSLLSGLGVGTRLAWGGGALVAVGRLAAKRLRATPVGTQLA